MVELVLEHAQETPDESLGAIAFGQHHADNIDNVLMRRLSEMNDSSLDEFFSESNEERFFVKNIERVQGDERDAIILSVGYHKDPNGNLPYRFGPILQEGGERRLNVAVTRARSKLTLVSSFSHRDMDPGRSSARGVELLRQYLEYAASGGQVLGSDVSDVPLNPFELSILDGLKRRGIPRDSAVRRLRLPHRLCLCAILRNLEGWSSPLRLMGQVTTQPRRPATVTASDSRCSRPRAGGSTASGRPSGSETVNWNSIGLSRHGSGLLRSQSRKKRQPISRHPVTPRLMLRSSRIRNPSAVRAHQYRGEEWEATTASPTTGTGSL